MGKHSHEQKSKLREVRSDGWKDQGKETPTGKKYSRERTVRLSPSISNGTGMVRKEEANAEGPSPKQPFRRRRENPKDR